MGNGGCLGWAPGTAGRDRGAGPGLVLPAADGPVLLGGPRGKWQEKNLAYREAPYMWQGAAPLAPQCVICRVLCTHEGLDLTEQPGLFSDGLVAKDRPPAYHCSPGIAS